VELTGKVFMMSGWVAVNTAFNFEIILFPLLKLTTTTNKTATP
jgi:hypothetical protein